MDKSKPLNGRPILTLPVKEEVKEMLERIRSSQPETPPNSQKSPEPTESLPPPRKHETPLGGSQRTVTIVNRYLRMGRRLKRP
jgi:hypothetical protein